MKMKKCLFILVAAVFSCNVCTADVFNITLYKCVGMNNDKVYHSPQERSMQVVPSVVYDDNANTITVTSGRLIENARITITDNNGSVVDCEVVNLSRTGVSIQVPGITERDTYKIEIEYGDTYLYGII